MLKPIEVIFITVISYFAIAACHSPLLHGEQGELVLAALYATLALCHTCIAVGQHDPNGRGPHPPPGIQAVS